MKRLKDLSEAFQALALNYCKNQHGVERADFCKEANPPLKGMFNFSETEEGFDFWEQVSEHGTPIAKCSRTETLIFPTEVEGYFGYCPELDEDVFEFETDPLTLDDEDKINEAKEAFQQWCSDDARVEMEYFEMERGKGVDLESGENADEFYLYLYDKGLRM